MAERRRRCLVTAEVKAAEDLVRFVVAPEGMVVPDVAGDLPGRGIWVSASREMVDAARARGLLAKAARRRVTVAEDLADLTEALLVARALGLLGLARRAGQVALGFEKVRLWLEAGKAVLLIAAREGSADGKSKLRRLAPGLPVVDCYTVAELSLALGRGNVVHAALAPGRLADRFLAETARAAGFGRLSALQSREPRSGDEREERA